MTTAKSHLALATALLGLCLTLTACGDQTGEVAAEPTGRQTAISGGEAAGYLLAEEELPQGWRHATGEQHHGIPYLCDVKLEPPSLASADTQRYGKSFAGPFVIQYSFVASNEEAAARTVDTLAANASTCTEFDMKGVEVTVSPIDDVPAVGTGFTALRATKADDAKRHQDWVVFRDGTHITVLIGYSVDQPPARKDLADIASAIAAKA